MSIAVTVVINFVYYLLGVVQIAMLIRALLSWVMPDGSGLIVDFVYAITEPFIAIIRKLLNRLSLNVNSPIDISFMITVVLIEIIRLVITAFI